MALINRHVEALCFTFGSVLSRRLFPSDGLGFFGTSPAHETMFQARSDLGGHEAYEEYRLCENVLGFVAREIKHVAKDRVDAGSTGVTQTTPGRESRHVADSVSTNAVEGAAEGADSAANSADSAQIDLIFSAAADKLGLVETLIELLPEYTPYWQSSDIALPSVHHFHCSQIYSRLVRGYRASCFFFAHPPFLDF
jgi:hypothetical protein